MNIKDLLISLPALVFVLWVFVAPLPQDRIARGCAPIQWVGNLATSTTALAVEDHTPTTARWSDKLDYSCRYMIWRLLYQDAYNEALEKGLINADGSPVQAPTQSPAQAPAQPAVVPAPTQAEKKPAHEVAPQKEGAAK